MQHTGGEKITRHKGMDVQSRLEGQRIRCSEEAISGGPESLRVSRGQE